MDFRLSPKEEAFKSDLLCWLEQNLPEGYRSGEYRLPDTWEKRVQEYSRFQKALFQGGYAGIRYPKEYGGRGGSLMEEIIVLELLAPIYRDFGSVGIIGHGMASPTIHICGTEEHKRSFLPRILDGSHIWCQGFSEPNAGSDVANVSTRAEKRGNEYIINGQKTWTSFAHIADYCILLARTDPNTAKHKGLSYFLMDMKLPGIEVRPIRQITGEPEFNEVFLEDVRVPEAMRVGVEGQGWQIAITTLMFERVIGDISMAALYSDELRRMLNMAGQVKRNGQAVLENPIYRQQMAQCYIELMVLKYNGYRNVSKLIKNEIPGPEGSIGKLLWSELHQKMGETAMQIQGPYHQIMKDSPSAIDNGFWQHLFLRSKGNTIEAGTSEILRNIIGERVLGLPKDVSRAVRREGR
ncbi:MAG: acyl-CoA dehydrogenase family protein [Deltaproteobacteria bacterium]|nr:acyl-CoA dehydrogenase family protein [Deltaproteobacteria bacterium]